MSGNENSGRKSKYKPEYCQEIIDFFDIKVVKIEDGDKKIEPPRTFAGFARKIKVTQDTLLNWCDHFPEWKEAYELAKDIAEDNILIGGSMNAYNPTMCIFNLKNNYGYKDRQEITGDPAAPLSISWEND